MKNLRYDRNSIVVLQIVVVAVYHDEFVSLVHQPKKKSFYSAKKTLLHKLRA